LIAHSTGDLLVTYFRSDIFVLLTTLCGVYCIMRCAESVLNLCTAEKVLSVRSSEYFICETIKWISLWSYNIQMLNFRFVKRKGCTKLCIGLLQNIDPVIMQACLKYPPCDIYLTNRTRKKNSIRAPLSPPARKGNRSAVVVALFITYYSTVCGLWSLGNTLWFTATLIGKFCTQKILMRTSVTKLI
jgi:hypothetical protein